MLPFCFHCLSDLVLFLPLLLPPGLQLPSHRPKCHFPKSEFHCITPVSLPLRFQGKSWISPTAGNSSDIVLTPGLVPRGDGLVRGLVVGLLNAGDCADLQISNAPHYWSCTFLLHRIYDCFSLNHLSLQILPSTLLEMFLCFGVIEPLIILQDFWG